MTDRTRLKNTIAHSSAETSVHTISDSHVRSIPTTDIDAARAHLVTDSDRVATRTTNNAQTATGNVTAAKTLPVPHPLHTHSEIYPLVRLLDNPYRPDTFDNIATSAGFVLTYLSAELRDTFQQTLPDPLFPS